MGRFLLKLINWVINCLVAASLTSKCTNPLNIWTPVRFPLLCPCWSDFPLCTVQESLMNVWGIAIKKTDKASSPSLFCNFFLHFFYHLERFFLVSAPIIRKNIGRNLPSKYTKRNKNLTEAPNFFNLSKKTFKKCGPCTNLSIIVWRLTVSIP